MLISFSVENWQSFRDKATLSMVASREKQHQNHITKADKYGFGLLPIAAIYGGNASGKTKFFNALQFAQGFITRITQPGSLIPREAFKLDKKCLSAPSKFTFELLIENISYEFSFAVTEKSVTEEKLTKISTNSEKVLYWRKLNQPIEFPDVTLKKDERLRFVSEGTRDNQLLLTKCIDENIPYFNPIYDWFKNNLVLISPESKYHGSLSSLLTSNLLSRLDTSITYLKEIDVPFELLSIPEPVKARLLESIPEGYGTFWGLENKSFYDRVMIVKKDGILQAKKTIPYHKSIDGEDVPFEFRDESAGTERIIELLPILHDLAKNNMPRTYLIDEFDRCLHTLITRNIIEMYLRTRSSESNSQLIFTTHDVLLMDQDLLRRDEVWVTERDENGNSSLTSFSEYKEVRSDKDIRKSYLQGRLGGIPKIFLWESDFNDKN